MQHSIAYESQTRFAAGATWGGLALEALVALLCLLPSGTRIAIGRHASLLAFCATTYALAPVAGFGWLSATMGLALCGPDQRKLKRAPRRKMRGLVISCT